MKYLCLVYFEPHKLDALSPQEGAQLTNDSIDYDAQLNRRGKYITSDALDSADKAKTVRVRDGRISTTDGPFAETKEVLAGFVMIDAKDQAEAIELAAGIPIATFGSIEVRPVLQLSKT